jgi:hypothetical protein
VAEVFGDAVVESTDGGGRTAAQCREGQGCRPAEARRTVGSVEALLREQAMKSRFALSVS